MKKPYFKKLLKALVLKVNQHMQNNKFKIYIFFIFGFFSLDVIASKLENELKAIATETQKHLPAQLADGVEAIALVALGKNLVAQYKLDLTMREFKEDKLLAKEFEVSSINSQCTDPRMRGLLRRGAIFTFRFTDIVGKFLTEIVVNENSCKRNGL